MDYRITIKKKINLMENESTRNPVDGIIEKIGELIPIYMQNEIDRTMSGGNVAIAIIEEDGKVTGKIFGTNKIRGREVFRVAWTKGSQVWITGMRTGEYEKKIFNDEIDEGTFGIRMPDLIGWQGGQPVTLKNGTKLSIGFSGFSGKSDLEIVAKAVAMADVS